MISNNKNLKVIVFRVDSSKEIGFGHFSRCFSLAQNFKGYKIIFFCSYIHKQHNDLLKKNNIYLIKLNTLTKNKHHKLVYSKKKQIEDSNKCISKIKKNYKIKYIFIDSYNFDHIWEKNIYKFTEKLIVIDDLANRKHFADIVIDQNLHNNNNTRYKHLILKRTKLLTGLKYVILNDNIIKYKTKYKKNKKIIEILVFFGGTDIKNLTIKLLNLVIKKNLFVNFNFTFIATSKYNNLEKIIELTKKFSIKLIIDTNRMGYFINKSDLIISTGGIFTWEKLYFLKPSIVIPSNINQIPTLKNLEKKGCIKLIYDYSLSKTKTYNFFIKIFNDLNAIIKMTLKCKNLVDGKGIKRIINNLN